MLLGKQYILKINVNFLCCSSEKKEHNIKGNVLSKSWGRIHTLMGATVVSQEGKGVPNRGWKKHVKYLKGAESQSAQMKQKTLLEGGNVTDWKQDRRSHG